jgi:hypothetical protein
VAAARLDRARHDLSVGAIRSSGSPEDVKRWRHHPREVELCVFVGACRVAVPGTPRSVSCSMASGSGLPCRARARRRAQGDRGQISASGREIADRIRARTPTDTSLVAVRRPHERRRRRLARRDRRLPRLPIRRSPGRRHRHERRPVERASARSRAVAGAATTAQSRHRDARRRHWHPLGRRIATTPHARAATTTGARSADSAAPGSASSGPAVTRRAARSGEMRSA